MDQKEAAPAKKPRKLLRLLMGGGVLAGAAAGGLFYAQAAGFIQVPGMSASHEDPDKPHLVPREGVTPTSYVVNGDRPVEAKQFQVTYFPLKDNFTSNLKDDSGFIQVGLGVSTYYDERVIENLERHEMAVRSAILMNLANQDIDRLSTPQGKLALKAQLTGAINDVLRAKEGFGGIDDVYFTGFVMQ